MEITNKKGDGFEYGESPHDITVTANQNIFVFEEPGLQFHEEHYYSEESVEEEIPLPQE